MGVESATLEYVTCTRGTKLQKRVAYVRDCGLLGSANSPETRRRAYDNFSSLTNALCEYPFYRPCPTIKGNYVVAAQSCFEHSPIDCKIILEHPARYFEPRAEEIIADLEKQASCCCHELHNCT